MRLSTSAKKLIGTLIILVWLVVYAFLMAMGVGAYVLVHAPWYVAMLYYAMAGTLWIIPIGLLLPWMYREPTPKA